MIYSWKVKLTINSSPPPYSIMFDRNPQSLSDTQMQFAVNKPLYLTNDVSYDKIKSLAHNLYISTSITGLLYNLQP